MTSETYAWRPAGVRWGIIAGVIVVGLFVVAYFLKREWVLSRGLWLGTTLVYMLAMYRAQEPVRGQDPRAYIQPGFLTFVVANALFYLFYHLLFAVFDPGLVELQAAALSAAGQDPDKAQIPTPGSTFFTYAQSLIFGFVLAAAIGLGLRARSRSRD
ncbi:MAG: DUF4199 family protein [Bacteroidetes bacterium]|nr:MAG: DUF4199 family protein [Bacteroidota bacterium]